MTLAAVFGAVPTAGVHRAPPFWGLWPEVVKKNQHIPVKWQRKDIWASAFLLYPNTVGPQRLLTDCRFQKGRAES